MIILTLDMYWHTTTHLNIVGNSNDVYFQKDFFTDYLVADNTQDNGCDKYELLNG